ncbi:hypothetical protein CON07_23335 [Bacillus sp. AFS094611]|uniref:S-layer homology domain-containing protein n=1 Tax=Bacillus sp. AFS094611 TaxID=2033516 RepID=UPI000BED3B90|nr:S-layer homology domain-containing protein [Bacillus sp. AFS094611]PDZ49169.1 hypothetical protein CON07_23335 [Bacillus sp. AFS094611]
MNFKSVLATGLITTTLFGATTTTHAQTKHFTDVPSGHWSENSINFLNDKGIVSGYGDGIFGFGDNVTRGQVASIMARYFNLKDNESQKISFNDIKNHMFENSIKAVTQAGIMVGDGSDKFRPDDTLTRYEMAVILKHAFNLEVKKGTPFNDVPNNHWAREAIKALYSNGVTDGVGPYEYGGKFNVTREQFATFMYKSIFKDQNPTPEQEQQNNANKLKHVAEENGFFLNDLRYTYNPYGKEGNPTSNIMDLFIQDGSVWETKMLIHNDVSAVEKPIKEFLNILTPTQGDELLKIIRSEGPIHEELELDRRTVVIERYQTLSVLFGYKK